MRTLYCTVGGNPKPILISILHWSADFVVFVASEDDPIKKENEGSYTQVSKETKFGKSLVELAKLEKNWSILKIPADNAEVGCERIVEDVSNRNGEIIIDFTGGTKSMSAAAFLAANLINGTLSLVTGERANHEIVKDGTENVQSWSPDYLSKQILLKKCEELWKEYHWEEASKIIKRTNSRNPFLNKISIVGLGLSSWDKGEYETAHHLISGYLVDKDHKQALARLKKNEEAWKIWDFYLMALRACLYRKDEAILLLYRVVEWIAQWALKTHHNINPSDIKDEPEIIKDLIHSTRDDKKVMGLVNCWIALSRLDGPFAYAAKQIVDSKQKVVSGPLLGFVDFRNKSRFAHGEKPVTQKDFDDALDFFERYLKKPFLESAFNGKEPFPQLPDNFSFLYN